VQTGQFLRPLYGTCEQRGVEEPFGVRWTAGIGGN
jgi:hypothetical protein